MTRTSASHELESQLDRNYRYQRYVYDLTRRYYLLGREDCLRDLSPPTGGTVLEMGCGTARNLILAAKMYPKARLFGVDLSGEMLATARTTLARIGLSDRIALAHADATTFEGVEHFGVRRFDRIFFSYVLSMIPPWERAIEHATSILEPGGSLHIVDFGSGSALPRTANAALRNWLQRFHVTPRDSLVSVVHGIAERHRMRARVEPLYGTYAVRAVLQAGAPSSLHD